MNTPSQQRVIETRGNVVVLAGAGTGKTRTLVERTVRSILDGGVGLDELLMVTFTDAAAAEMRHRIRARLEAELATRGAEPRLVEQLALLDAAFISTLHSFCLQLVRQHFYELGLDPQLTVLSEEQSSLLAAEVLDELLEECYAGKAADSSAVLDLLQTQMQGWDKPLRELLIQLHNYAQTCPDPDGWREQQLLQLAHPDPKQWRDGLIQGFDTWRNRWLPVLSDEPPENVNAHNCAQELMAFTQGTTHGAALDGIDDPARARERVAEVLRKVLAQDEWPGKKTFRKPLEKLFEEAAFLHSLAAVGPTGDPLTEDWSWVRGPLSTVLKFSKQFAERFANSKRDGGLLDFHDFEQFALRLLWDTQLDQPTPLARQWRERLKLVFVDEYQDINAAQDRILSALGREGAEANRFLVGDVKQSIYRFRQAAPKIFQRYASDWSRNPDQGTTLPLSDNFRSHEALLEFINPLFRSLMRAGMGGVDYDADAELRFGNPEGREAQRLSPLEGGGARVECHFLLTSSSNERDNDETEGASLEELSDAEQEARMLAARLWELRRAGHPVWDEEKGEPRPVRWSDMVVLLRSPRSKVESYSREFNRAGIPLQAHRSGFFGSIEVLDLIHLLTLLDNPLQDLPAIAVLRSPLVGLTLDELARIRLSERKVRFWVALQGWYRRGGRTHPSTFQKVDRFLKQFERWRAMSRHASLAHRLEAILSETCYTDWLLTQPRGEQRRANVQQLLAVTRQFDELHSQGLYRFLRYIEAQQEIAGDTEPAPLETEDAVRLTSIHQSKGLEFPVVAVADLGKRFKLTDTTSGILLDDFYGLCLLVKPPGSRRSYPSLPYWLARQKQREESLGEELRLLYVAMTRARDLLILSGVCSADRAGKNWTDGRVGLTHQLLKAGRYLDWIGPWLTVDAGSANWFETDAGETPRWRWRIHRSPVPLSSPEPPPAPALTPLTTSPGPAEEQVRALRERIEWSYPFDAATREPAKTSVTALRRGTTDDSDGEAKPACFVRRTGRIQLDTRRAGLSAAAIGTAHHRFLQWVALEKTGTMEDLESEAGRLTLKGALSPEEAQSLDLEAVRAFWQSPCGAQIREHVGAVRRELPFTMRLTQEDLSRIQVPLFEEMVEGDFIVAQGVIDLAVVLPDEIWLLDFKTDDLKPAELGERTELYAPQLKLYAHALSGIHRRPVTHRWLHYLTVGETVEIL